MTTTRERPDPNDGSLCVTNSPPPPWTDFAMLLECGGSFRLVRMCHFQPAGTIHSLPYAWLYSELLYTFGCARFPFLWPGLPARHVGRFS